MITKKKFIETLNYIKDRRVKNDKLIDAMEAMADGCYCDFYCDSGWESLTIDLLKLSLGLSEENEDIEYFIYDLEFGKYYKPGCITDQFNKDIDISTASKLYDYLTKNKK